jgi:hypothetical protein
LFSKSFLNAAVRIIEVQHERQSRSIKINGEIRIFLLIPFNFSHTDEVEMKEGGLSA